MKLMPQMLNSFVRAQSQKLSPSKTPNSKYKS